MPDTNRRVQAIIDRYVAELSQVAREEAARMVLAGLESSSRSNKTAANGARSGGSRGTKRSPANLEALQTKVHDFIKSHGGLRIEEINAKLGTSTKDLARPLKKLIVAKAIKTTGQRRATRYFAGGAKGTKKRGKKAKSSKK